VNSRKQTAPQRCAFRAPGGRLHPAEHDAARPGLCSNLRKDAPVKHVEELGHAYKHRDPMPVKCIDDALRRYRGKKDHRGADAERPHTVRNEGENVRERQYRQDAVIRRKLKRLNGPSNLMIQIVKGKLHAFGITCRPGRVYQNGRIGAGDRRCRSRILAAGAQ
jgi:hypothetical protein